MERQLKERLIGAAVLMAAAVVMVPEMFSGPRSRSEPLVDASSASSDQLKTYRIELQSGRSSEPAAVVTVEAPAEQPSDEVPVTADVHVSDSSNAASVSSEPVVAAEPVAPVAKPASQPPAKPETPTKADPEPRPLAGNWVVQVGSFASQDKAQQIAGKLKDQGYPAYLGTVTVTGRTLYRVRVGAMAERSAAEATLRKLKSSYPAASVVPVSR